MTLSYSTPSLRPDTLLVCPFPFRCGGADGGSHSHRFHCGNLLRADRSDLSHPSHDGRRHPGQHGCAGSATVTVRLHHPGQEAALSPRAGLRPHKVRRHCKYQCRGSTYATRFPHPRMLTAPQSPCDSLAVGAISKYTCQRGVAT